MNSTVQEAQPTRHFCRVDLCEVSFSALKPKYQNSLNVEPDLEIPEVLNQAVKITEFSSVAQLTLKSYYP